MEKRNRILFIEDDSLLLKAITFKLEKDDFDVVFAADGKEALRLLQVDTFDLVICDIMLPFVNGLEIVRNMRGRYNLKTPVIILSSVGTEEAVLEAYDLGVDDYITKPFSPNELTIRIKKILQKRD